MSVESRDWRDRFCGRQAELARLRESFAAVARGEGPRCMVVLGDRGMGKTRLVWEFYRHLTSAHDPEHYWPAAALFQGRNLRFAPELSDPAVKQHFASFTLGERAMPFLWWGLRVGDPEDRNAVRADLAAHRRTLDPHLGPLIFSRRLAAHAATLGQLGVDVGKSAALKAVEAIPVAGWLLSLALEATEKGLAARQALRAQREAEAEQAAADVASLGARGDEDLLTRTLNDLAAILAPHPEQATLPVVVFCDDAQFLGEGGDEGTLRLLTTLWERARTAGWPLLLVATHWTLDWHRDREHADDTAVREQPVGPRSPALPQPAVDRSARRFAARFAPIVAQQPLGALIELAREPALRELIDAGLPGLVEGDVAMLLDKADGNPQVLIELVDRVRRAPAWRGPDGALTTHGRAQVVAHTTDLTRLILDRLQGDTTPEQVRRAVALSAAQGMQFLCALTDAASRALALGPALPALADAETGHRLVIGVEAGLAHFVQRAYRDAARELLGAHVGDPAVVDDALVRVAVATIDDDAAWRGLPQAEQLSMLGILVSLGTAHADRWVRLRSAGALVALTRHALSDGVRDFAQAAALANRWLAGLDAHWTLADFTPDDLDLIYEALITWSGPHAGAPLLVRLLEHARARVREDRSQGNQELLLRSLDRAAQAALQLGERPAGHAFAEEAVALARTLEAEHPSSATRRNLAAVLQTLDALSDDRRAKAAATEEAHYLLKQRAELDPNDDTRRDLAYAERRLGQLALSFDDIAGAKRAFTAAAEIRFSLTAQQGQGTLDDWERFMDALDDLSRVAELEQDWQRVYALGKITLDHRRGLLQMRSTPYHRSALAHALERVARLHLRFEQADEALPYLQQADPLRAALNALIATPLAALDYAQCRLQLGEALLLHGEQAAAREVLEHAGTLLDSVTDPGLAPDADALRLRQREALQRIAGAG